MITKSLSNAAPAMAHSAACDASSITESRRTAYVFKLAFKIVFPYFHRILPTDLREADKIQATQNNAQKYEVAKLMEHFEQGDHGQQEIGGCMQISM